MSTVGQLKQWLADLPDDELVAAHLFVRQDADDYMQDRNEDDGVRLTDEQWQFVVRMFEQLEGQHEEFVDCIWYSARA
jgi:hypothetical protein